MCHVKILEMPVNFCEAQWGLSMNVIQSFKSVDRLARLLQFASAVYPRVFLLCWAMPGGILWQKVCVLCTCGSSEVENLLVHQMVNLTKCCGSTGRDTCLMLRGHGVFRGCGERSNNCASECLEINFTIPGSAVDWVSCIIAAGLASCRSEADGNERRCLNGF